MKSLVEIYWDIDHECLHSDKTISFSDEIMMLSHAAEEYVEELIKHDGSWKSIVLHDIDYLKASSFGRREQTGYSEGAEIFLDFVYQELERYGFKIDDKTISSVKETNQHEIIPETGDNKQTNQETNQSIIVPETKNDKENPKTNAQIMMSIENEPFKPKKDGKPIPYQKCFERLTMGKIRRSAGESEPVEVIDKQYDSELFKYCVDRANIKYLIKEKKCFAYLFLRCISEYFENPFEYRKAAAKSFGIKSISSVGGVTKSDFYNLFSGVFKNEDIPRKKRK